MRAPVPVGARVQVDNPGSAWATVQGAEGTVIENRGPMSADEAAMANALLGITGHIFNYAEGDQKLLVNLDGDEHALHNPYPLTDREVRVIERNDRVAEAA